MQHRADARGQSDNRRVDHLYGSVMGGSHYVHNPGPCARWTPTNEAIVAGGVRTKTSRQIPSRRSGAQNPEDTVEDMAIVHPRDATRLVR
jgi:hypothetical protein